MIPVDLTVLVDGEPKTTTAWTTKTPGLVAHKCFPGDEWAGEWVVAHQRSGAVVAWLNDPEHAQQVADALGAVTDWTCAGEELLRRVDDCGAAERLVEKLGGDCRRTDPSPDPFPDLNEVSA